jgi:Protein of unknown function (Porph_ging).
LLNLKQKKNGGFYPSFFYLNLKKMKSLLYILFATFLGTTAHAQNNTVAIYNFSHCRDTNNLSNIYKEEMMLIFNAEASLYKSYTLFKYDSLRDIKTSQPNYTPEPSIKLPRANTDQQFYFFKQNEYDFLTHFGENSVVKDTIDAIKWAVTDSSKTIGSLLCYKATCNFKGRHYTAWYAPEIAVKAGPWKLNGLPGLIVEAKDDKEQVKFELTSLRSAVNQPIALPQEKHFVTKQKLKEIMDAFHSDPIGFMNAQFAADAAAMSSGNKTVSINFSQIGGNNPNPNKVIKKMNNPIELTD